VDGARRRAPWVIGFHRTGDGDFLQLRRPTPYGTTTTIAPVTGQLLFTHLTELLRAAPAT
jgi:hypothetical protein